MKLILAIAVGGAIGAVARFQSVALLTRWFGTEFPYGTLFVNIAGSFLMGVFVELLTTKFNGSAELKAFLVVGILGAFTTFSSFALDVSTLMERGNLLPSIAYIFSSVCFSIIGLFGGIFLMRNLIT